MTVVTDTVPELTDPDDVDEVLEDAHDHATAETDG